MKELDKCKDFWGLLGINNVIECGSVGVDELKKDTRLYNALYKELSELIGVEATLEMYNQFKGQQITFPVRLYSSDSIKNQVLKEFNGANFKELAKKYGYSEKTIRRMASRIDEKSRKKAVSKDNCVLRRMDGMKEKMKASVNAQQTEYILEKK